MGKDSEPQSTTTNTQPWKPQQAHLKHGFSQARSLYDANPVPEAYPGQTYADIDPATFDAMNMARGFAMGSPLEGAANQSVLDLVMGPNGAFGQDNPYLNDVIAGSNRDAQDVFAQLTPQIDGRFMASGRSGSGAHMGALGQAAADVAAAAGDRSAQYRYGDYNRSLSNILPAAGMLPTMQGAEQSRINTLNNVGGRMEDQQRAQINDALQKYNFNQNAGFDQLGRYMGLVQGNYGGTSTSTAQGGGGSPLSGALGGAAAGMSLGGPWGAAAGGLLGLFG